MIVALIPARSGSVRIPNKNIRNLAGHPLMAYSIASALESGLFDRIIVSTDSWEYLKIANKYGAEVFFENIEGRRYDVVRGEVVKNPRVLVVQAPKPTPTPTLTPTPSPTPYQAGTDSSSIN